jgi:chlorite dismutase
MAKPLTVTFSAGRSGIWHVDRIVAVCGEGLPAADRLTVFEDAEDHPEQDSNWRLRGVTSNARYTNRPELNALVAAQPTLHRPYATCAALIPIRKTTAWWDLAQDERRAIFEEQSHHIKIGHDYLPGVARRLHHSRDLGEPFDFLTWFEYAPEQAGAFEAMLHRLRGTAEWRYVDREVDIRLRRS